MELVLSVLVAAGVFYGAWRLWNAFQRVTVYQFQRGLLYHKGKFQEALAPGQYWIYAPTRQVTLVDMRPLFVSIPGQEVLSSDGVTLKASLACEYEIADPDVAINQVQNFHEAFYLTMQMAFREVVSGARVDEVLENRQNIGQRLVELVSGKVGAFGLRLRSANVKDLMFPGELKKVFSQVVKAQKEGLANLEKARGETAALRNLANAARMMQDNPALLHIRLLQHIGSSGGNTVVLGVPASSSPLPIQKGKTPSGEIPPAHEDASDE